MILFGKNLIDVAGKSIFTLLVEEVCTCHNVHFGDDDTNILSLGFTSILRLSNCQYNTLEH